MTVTLQFAAVGGVTLHYKVDGPDDGAPLVFINSLGTDLRIWDGVVGQFARKFRVIRYDKRGHGLSDSPPGPYTLADERADLAGLLAYLGVGGPGGRPPIVTGVSVGGMIAVDYAAHYPVAALVVCDSARRFATATFWNERSAVIRQQGMTAVAPRLAPRWFAPDFAKREPAAYRGYVNMLARMPADGYIATCDLLAQADVTEQAERVQAPALVVGGAQDMSSPPNLVRALAEALPDAQFNVIEGAGHLPCVEQPQALAQLMTGFFEQEGALDS